MISNRFTILELTDLALRVPEIGAVNFNILHTVLTTLILKLELGNLKTPCHIEDEVLAQAAITKGRIDVKAPKRPSRVFPIETMKEKMKDVEAYVVLKKDGSSSTSEEEIHSASEEDDSREEISEGKKQEKQTVSKEVSSKTEARTEGSGSEKDRHIEEGTKEETTEDERPEEEAVIDELNENPEDESEESEPEKLSTSELKEVNQDLMESGAERIADRVGVVTEPLGVLTYEELLEDEPAKVIEEMWRATHINRRMDGAETGLRNLSEIVDMLLDKIQDLEDSSGDVLGKAGGMLSEMGQFFRRIESLEDTSKSLSFRIEESNEVRAQEVERLEVITDDLKKEDEGIKTGVDNLQEYHAELSEKVALRVDLGKLKTETSEDIRANIKEVTKFVKEVEETLTKKSDFIQVVDHLDVVQETKIDREELGPLLIPGFIDSLLKEIQNLRIDVDELKVKVAELTAALEALKIKLEVEIMEMIEKKFSDVQGKLDAMNEKLDQLDPDEINDSFANLEELTAGILSHLDEMKQSFEQLQKDSRQNFGRITNASDLIKKLETSKVDKLKLYELLELKADIDMLMGKLDRAEFAAVIGDIKDNLERLTITVKINEEEMSATFLDIRHELALKMYTEDFITATEPIRNRIKALIYELDRVKQISLTHLFPDAPGIAKCISCKRGAHLAGPKHLGDANIELLQEVTPKSHVRMAIDKSPRPRFGTDSQETSDTRLLPIDLDSVPIPPPDKPRERNPLNLPVLFATARPQIGLTHERRKKTIDKKLAAYFASRPIRPIDGEYTRTVPQQRGLDFTAVVLPQPEKEEVLLEGTDKGLYRGATYEGYEVDDTGEEDETIKEEPRKMEKPDIKSLKEPRTKKGFIKPVIKKPTKKKDGDDVIPSTVSLHVNNEPLQKSSHLPNRSEKVLLPSHKVNKKTK